jgi:phage-related protein
MPLDFDTLNSSIAAMKVDANGIKAGVDSLTTTTTNSCNVLGSCGSLLGDKVKELAKDVEKAVGEALKGLGQLSSKISEALKSATDFIKQIKNKLSKLTASAVAAINGAFSKMQAAITGAKDSVSTGPIKDIFNQINSGLNSIISNIKTAIGGITKATCKVTSDALKSMGAGASSEIDSLKSAISSASGDITGSIGSAVSSASSGVTSAVSSVAGGVTSAVNSAAQGLATTGKEVQNIATNLVGTSATANLNSLSSVASGLGSSIGDLAKSAGGSIDSALSNLKKFAV